MIKLSDVYERSARAAYRRGLIAWRRDVKRSLREARLREATHALSKSDSVKLTNALILSTCELKRVNLKLRSEHNGSDSGDE